MKYNFHTSTFMEALLEESRGIKIEFQFTSQNYLSFNSWKCFHGKKRNFMFWVQRIPSLPRRGSEVEGTWPRLMCYEGSQSGPRHFKEAAERTNFCASSSAFSNDQAIWNEHLQLTTAPAGLTRQRFFHWTTCFNFNEPLPGYMLQPNYNLKNDCLQSTRWFWFTWSKIIFLFGISWWERTVWTYLN